MKKRLPLLSSHLSVGITENELYSLEEVTLPRAIAPNNDIVLGREWFGDSLILVAMRKKCQQREFAIEGFPLTS